MSSEGHPSSAGSSVSPRSIRGCIPYLERIAERNGKPVVVMDNAAIHGSDVRCFLESRGSGGDLPAQMLFGQEPCRWSLGGPQVQVVHVSRVYRDLGELRWDVGRFLSPIARRIDVLSSA